MSDLGKHLLFTSYAPAIMGVAFFVACQKSPPKELSQQIDSFYPSVIALFSAGVPHFLNHFMNGSVNYLQFLLVCICSMLYVIYSYAVHAIQTGALLSCFAMALFIIPILSNLVMSVLHSQPVWARIKMSVEACKTTSATLTAICFCSFVGLTVAIRYDPTAYDRCAVGCFPLLRLFIAWFLDIRQQILEARQYLLPSPVSAEPQPSDAGLPIFTAIFDIGLFILFVCILCFGIKAPINLLANIM